MVMDGAVEKRAMSNDTLILFSRSKINATLYPFNYSASG